MVAQLIHNDQTQKMNFEKRIIFIMTLQMIHVR